MTYEFAIDGGDRALAEQALDEVEGVAVALGAGTVTVSFGDEAQLRRAWGVLEALAGAGYVIVDLVRGRAVDVAADFDDVLQTYLAVQRLPGR